MNNFNYKQRNLTSGPHLLGTLLMIAGLFALLSPILFKSTSSLDRTITVGLGAMILGLVIVSSYSGTMIDFTQNRFKEYWSVAGFQFGEWMTLPGISKVKVISTSYISSNTPNGISPTLSGKVTDFKTLLYSNASNPLLSFDYSSRDKAVMHAEHLASDLNAELVLAIPEGQ